MTEDIKIGVDGSYNFYINGRRIVGHGMVSTPQQIFIEAPLSKLMEALGPCEWKWDNNIEAYESECGLTYCLMNEYGLKKNNHFHCPNCGRVIAEKSI